jgi:hypothetical protein
LTGRGRRYGLDDVPNRCLELIRELLHIRPPLGCATDLRFLLLVTQPVHLTRVFLEHMDGSGHQANLVLEQCAGAKPLIAGMPCGATRGIARRARSNRQGMIARGC